MMNKSVGRLLFARILPRFGVDWNINGRGL
jgi:hypothetical protein